MQNIKRFYYLGLLALFMISEEFLCKTSRGSTTLGSSPCSSR